MKTKQLEQCIEELLLRADIGVSVRLEKKFPGGRMVGGKYNMNTHTITMYTDVIQAQCQQMFGSLERAEDYFAVVLAHEIGHAADPELRVLSEVMDEADDPYLRRLTALRIEENAWNYTLNLLPEAESKFISIIIDESLLAYREKVQDRTVTA
ncbi:hypothetical protein OIN60_05305 [Paenibacillus sp. P96]|uniref:Uncharacterized protein n=1 Tax=Paenibacillus zeirhizosphaerae TaxID=2987519 RepID=A0ABT9FN79_9BACL|nr:hypothetical protein [Paenibacillus sp. P96]MDP4096187.1 hypothetical protein [Paenibacillus sp. P96]